MKKFFISLGACAVAVAVGLGILLSTKENRNIVKADSEVSLENLVLYTSGERDYSDLSVDGTTIFGGDFTFVNGDNYQAMSYEFEHSSLISLKFINNKVSPASVFTFYSDYSLQVDIKGYYLCFANITGSQTGLNSNTKQETLRLLRACFDVLQTSDKPWFNFNEQINYYAPYNANVSAQYVQDTSLVNSTSIAEQYLYEEYNARWFRVAGNYYNVVALVYVNAQGMIFEENGEPLQANGYGSYSFMKYQNSITGAILVVNTRDYRPTTYNGGQGYYQAMSSSWVSPTYKNIELLYTPTPSELANLNTLNNSNTIASDTYTKGGDIGLGSAFTLLGQAFSSVAGLLAIQVLPNITLGLLLFLPLIVGIIIAIVWIVKR